MPRQVGFDSTVIMHAFNLSEDDPKSTKAAFAIRALRKEKATLVLPAIVLTEYLRGLSGLAIYRDHPAKSLHAEHLARLQLDFIIAAFDTQAAVKAAEVYDLCHSLPNQKSGAAVKADYMVIGTLLSRGINEIVTSDGHFETMAKTIVGLKVLTIESFCDQPELPFGEHP